MTLLAQVSVLATLISLSIAISILVQKNKTDLQKLFAYLNINLAICFVSTFLLSFGYSLGKAGKLLFLLSFLGIPLQFLRFFRLFVPEMERAFQNILRVAYPLTAFFTFWTILSRAKDSLLFTLEAIYVLLTLFVTITLIWLHYHAASTNFERSRLRPVYIGGYITILLVLLDMMSYRLDWPYVFLANFGVAIYMYFLLQLIITTRALDLNELLSKGAILSVLSVIIASIYWLMTFWVGTKELGSFFISVLVASVIILILYEPLKTAIGARTSRLFFSQKQELRQLLQELHKDLINIIDIQQAAHQMIQTLSTSSTLTHVSFFSLRNDGRSFECISYHGESPLLNINYENAASLLYELKGNVVGALVRKEIEFHLNTKSFSFGKENELFQEKERLLEILRGMRSLKAEVCVPCLSSEQELLGFLCFNNERFEESYSQTDLERMKSVAGQFAVTIENSKLFESIQERDRLAAIGEMSAGLAHEIRNPLGAIKGAAQLLNPEHLPASEREMVQIILEEVDRLNSVVVQFLDYARPLQIRSEEVDIHGLLQKTLQLFQVSFAVDSSKHKIQLKMKDHLPLIHGDSEKLKQVFLNFIRNGLEAMKEGGQMTISTDWIESPSLSKVLISFQDEGGGIAEEIQKNIFIPFFTTKEKGTGLGLSICQKIVESHGGEIKIVNTPLGCTFQLFLPVTRSFQRNWFE